MFLGFNIVYVECSLDFSIYVQVGIFQCVYCVGVRLSFILHHSFVLIQSGCSAEIVQFCFHGL